MKLLILNDLHLGVKRQGGTTKASREALSVWMLQRFANLLAIPHDHLLIAGDLFDKRNVDEEVMDQVIELLQPRPCSIMLGNHDLDGNMGGMSSAEFVGRRVRAEVIKEPCELFEGVYVIPHLFNQGAFDKAIEEVPDYRIVVTHCNVDNYFANGDHSLNLSLPQIMEFEKKDCEVLAAHEHHQRQYHNVVVIGNQFPSSVADCLSWPKRAAVIDGGKISFVETWDGRDYIDLDWRDIKQTEHKFIRVSGECQAAEYPAVISKIKELRRASDAFVISSAVKPQVKEKELLTKEEVTNFNILQLLLETVDEAYKEEIRSCM